MCARDRDLDRSAPARLARLAVDPEETAPVDVNHQRPPHGTNEGYAPLDRYSGRDVAPCLELGVEDT
jgi:hypothetical protein